jgi:hypothetical protein
LFETRKAQLQKETADEEERLRLEKLKNMRMSHDAKSEGNDDEDGGLHPTNQVLDVSAGGSDAGGSGVINAADTPPPNPPAPQKRALRPMPKAQGDQEVLSDVTTKITGKSFKRMHGDRLWCFMDFVVGFTITFAFGIVVYFGSEAGMCVIF